MTTKTLDILKLLRSKSIIDMDFMIAELLIKDNSEKTKKKIQFIARIRARLKGWEKNYKIPNINGLGRPLTKYEMLEIVNEGMYD
ncbi:hypothetical protein DA469_21300 [Bacillus subtilis]|nr:hypothetical protein DA469_21300 [Bacillus subtilis]